MACRHVTYNADNPPTDTKSEFKPTPMVEPMQNSRSDDDNCNRCDPSVALGKGTMDDGVVVGSTDAIANGSMPSRESSIVDAPSVVETTQEISRVRESSTVRDNRYVMNRIAGAMNRSDEATDAIIAYKPDGLEDMLRDGLRDSNPLHARLQTANVAIKLIDAGSTRLRAIASMAETEHKLAGATAPTKVTIGTAITNVSAPNIERDKG